MLNKLLIEIENNKIIVSELFFKIMMKKNC